MIRFVNRPHPTRGRRRAAIGQFVLVAAAIALAGGCAQHVSGVPVSAPGAASTGVVSAPSAVAAAPVTGGCRVKVAGGSIRMSGGGRVRSVNQAHEFACRNGPLIAIASVDAAGVRFRLDGSDVQIGAGTTGQVGPYRITIVNLDAPAAEFDVAPAG